MAAVALGVSVAAFSTLIAAPAAPSGSDRAAVEIRFWTARVERDPSDHLSPTRLGILCLREARRSGDLTLYARSEDALRLALQRQPGHVPALTSLAAACLGRHKFHDAREAAREAHKLQPNAPEVLAALGDALLESGDLDGAEKHYAKLAAALPGLSASSRVAHLRHARGDVAGAVAEMGRAIELGGEQGSPAEDLAWCHVQAGRLEFGRGEWERAQAHYDAALGLAPEDYRAADHLAELAAARGEYDAAISTYKRLADRLPRPELYQALGDVYRAAGRNADAKAWHDKALAAYLKDADAGNVHYHHHLAGYYCDVQPNGPEAVKWARKDIELRRTPATLAALAWALYADARFAESAKTMDDALTLGGAGVGPHGLYQASLIYTRAGDPARGRDCARRAAEANPRFAAFHVHR